MLCKHCGINPIGNRPGGAMYCLPCNGKPARIAAPDRARSGVYTPRREGGLFVCLDCSKPLATPVYGQARQSRLRCNPCGRARYELLRDRAANVHGIVARAIKRGELKHASELTCVDCGRPASQYDHRDYTKPLQVDPVCRSCNVMRGPADFPPLPRPTTPEANPTEARME
jgi:hypothetical protein